MLDDVRPVLTSNPRASVSPPRRKTFGRSTLAAARIHPDEFADCYLVGAGHGDLTKYRRFPSQDLLDCEDTVSLTDLEDDEIIGVSNAVGKRGLHPDRTPIDVLMANEDLSLDVGYELLNEED